MPALLAVLLAIGGVAAFTARAHGAECTVSPGSDGQILIRATVLAGETEIEKGEVLVDTHGMIACVGASCGAQAKAATHIDCPNAILSPGFVNAHEHLAFGNIPPVPDSRIRYTHRHDWRKGRNGYASIETFEPATDTDLIAWMELRHLLAGETSVIGGNMAPGLLRNLDFFEGLEGLETPRATYAVFPLDDASGMERTSDCDYGALAATSQQVSAAHAYVIHLAEGIGNAARNEYRCTTDADYDTVPLPAGGGIANDILHGNVSVLHGIALDETMLSDLARRHVMLVWSPRSNLSLYGKTLDISAAMRLGIPVGLGTDWLFSGSMTMVREADCALTYTSQAGHPLSGKALWRMMTSNSAQAARMSGLIGVIAVDAAADLILVERPEPTADPYTAVVTARPSQLKLILRGGKALSGDAALLDTLGAVECETVDMAGHLKRICLATDGGKSYTALKARADKAGLWPAFFDGLPPVEPTCRALPAERIDSKPGATLGGDTER
ncbi:MAG: amidohydrolase family protein [Sphingobium sp.]